MWLLTKSLVHAVSQTNFWVFFLFITPQNRGGSFSLILKAGLLASFHSLVIAKPMFSRLKVSLQNSTLLMLISCGSDIGVGLLFRSLVECLWRGGCCGS